MIKIISNKPIVIFIMGPTASGKTKVAISLRNYLPVDIVSVDSGLIYKDLNIGTAKPTEKELLKAPHKLINIKNSEENYSVGEFKEHALTAISDIVHHNRIPLLVGGTMLYYKVLLEGLALLPSANMELRNHLLKEVKIIGEIALHKKLKKIDPISANRIHPNDLQRVIRALEVFLISGKTLSALIKKSTYNFPYRVIQFSLIPRNMFLLYDNIELRFREMLDLGFEKEVECLFNRKNLNINSCSINRIGYYQMWKFLSGDLSYREMIEQSIRATRHLAKHQMTWLKKWNNIHYVYNDSVSLSVNRILNIFKKFKSNMII
ncbi:tRNA (adenosine(37)-N6)-dimethylallyltransferase MiaA [Buchnera aphidicola]|uniref:tRNA (adenosine(37)-N6)-dimethylallyltransferase MiaA n=1 Tax=Buchnera aphidicola TaxID=9 RepID=UPI0034648C01